MIADKKKIGIIGLGNMGRAIAERIKDKYRLFVFDKDKEKSGRLKGVKLSENSVELTKNSDVIILAVKPQDFGTLLDEIRKNTGNKLIISIAAGIPTADIERVLGKVKVVRVMPNLPAKIGKGFSCLCKGRFANDGDVRFAKKIFDNLGETLILKKEDMMDAATAISGSGPGFLFYSIENKPESEWLKYSKKEFVPLSIATATDIGFSYAEAKLAVNATVEGSLALLHSSGLTPEELKKQVASKGGTTQAGFERLDKGGTLSEAFKAAFRRARDLGKKTKFFKVG